MPTEPGVNVAHKVHKILTDENREWMIGGEPRIPTLEEVDDTLDRMVRVLYDDEIGTIELGGIYMRKYGDHFDVFVHIGEIDD